MYCSTYLDTHHYRQESAVCAGGDGLVQDDLREVFVFNVQGKKQVPSQNFGQQRDDVAELHRLQSPSRGFNMRHRHFDPARDLLGLWIILKLDR